MPLSEHFNYKVKTQTSFGSPKRKGKEIVSDEHTDSDIVSSVSAKKIFGNDLPEIKSVGE